MKILYESEKVFVSSTLKNQLKIPKSFLKLPFDKIKDGILGKYYELSIVLVGERRIKNLNFKYRNKNKATNVLSFSLSNSSGEIFICPKVSKIDLLFLVIHASFHLKGHFHGPKMEKLENLYYKKFNLK